MSLCRRRFFFAGLDEDDHDCIGDNHGYGMQDGGDVVRAEGGEDERVAQDIRAEEERRFALRMAICFAQCRHECHQVYGDDDDDGHSRVFSDQPGDESKQSDGEKIFVRSRRILEAVFQREEENGDGEYFGHAGGYSRDARALRYLAEENYTGHDAPNEPGIWMRFHFAAHHIP